MAEEGQNITLHIAGKVYALKAQSPEAEQFMRLASESINEMLAKYDAMFPDKSVTDKLAFIALNQTVSKLVAQKKCRLISDEVEKVSGDLKNYLVNIESNR